MVDQLLQQREESDLAAAAAAAAAEAAKTAADRAAEAAARGHEKEEEDWDAEIGGADAPARPGYDPARAIAKRRVLRMAKCLTKSEKERFRAEERKRHSLLEEREREVGAVVQQFFLSNLG